MCNDKRSKNSVRSDIVCRSDMTGGVYSLTAVSGGNRAAVMVTE